MKISAPFTDVETALLEMRAGRMVVVVDDEDRENEGDLTLAAEKVTPEAINFMATHGRGLICLALPGERIEYLRLGPMSAENTSQFGTAFTESIDALGRGVTTGISAYDRAQTILAAIDPATRPQDLARPGHVFPLKARKGGVLVRAGQTEASVDLARMAGLVPAGVICEIMKENGEMARLPDLISFCQCHNLKMLTVAALIRYRIEHESHVHRNKEATLPIAGANFHMTAYHSEIDGGEHIALSLGHFERTEPVLVRVHRHCIMGDLFGTSSCECGANLQNSLKIIAKAGKGALIYLHLSVADSAAARTFECPVLASRVDATHCTAAQNERQTWRDIGTGSQILLDLNIRRIRFLTNHPRRILGLDGYGIELVEQVAITANAEKMFAAAPASVSTSRPAVAVPGR